MRKNKKEDIFNFLTRNHTNTQSKYKACRSIMRSFRVPTMEEAKLYYREWREAYCSGRI